MSNIRKQFAINAGSGLLSQVVVAIIGFILMPYAIWRLGKESYGVFQLARSAIVFFAILQVGMGPTLVRFCSMAFAQENLTEIRKISSNAQFILGLVGLAGTCILIALIPFFLNFYTIPIYLILDTSIMITCLALSFLLNMVCIVPNGLLLGSNRYDLTNEIDIITNLLRLGLIVAAFELVVPSIFSLGVCILIAQLFRFTALFFMASKILKGVVRFSLSGVDRRTCLSMLKFSSLNFIHSISTYIAVQFPLLIVGKILGLSAVAMFAPAILIAGTLQTFLGQLSRPLVPLASRAQAEGDLKKMGRWAMSISNLLMVIGLTLVLPICIFGQEIISMWLGPDLSHTWNVVAIMALSAIVAQPSGVIYFISLGGGGIKPSIYSMVVLSVFVSCGVTIGAYFLRWNLLEISLLILIITCIRSILYLPHAYSIEFVYKMRSFSRFVYVQPLLLFSVLVSCGYMIARAIGPIGFPFVLVSSTVMMIIFGTLSWRFILLKGLKSYIANYVRSRRGVLSREVP